MSHEAERVSGAAMSQVAGVIDADGRRGSAMRAVLTSVQVWKSCGAAMSCEERLHQFL
jgi:hypothetical protein